MFHYELFGQYYLPIVSDPLHFDADPDPRIRSGITDPEKIPVFLHTYIIFL